MADNSCRQIGGHGDVAAKLSGRDFVIDQPGKTAARAAVIVYVVAFIVGAIVMSFEMLGSRYLNPYFGSGIYTWAALISTVLAALCARLFSRWMARGPHAVDGRAWALP